MVIWLDANISPAIAKFVTDNFQIPCFQIESLPLDISDDEVIFQQAKKEGNVIVTTKDYDFIHLQERFGAPPKIIWLTCGNSSNAVLKQKLIMHLKDALKELETSDLVEIA